MILLTSARACVAPAAFAAAMLVQTASAQDISESHTKAARSAVAAINATGEFDRILPRSALALQETLIQKNPDQQDLIEKTVSEKALALASRRADLEREAANAYAKVFSEDDLNAIAAFYASPAGQKLIADGPIVTREVLKAAEIWQNGIARDLAQQVGDVLAKQAPQPASADPAASPPAEPAPAEPQN